MSTETARPARPRTSALWPGPRLHHSRGLWARAGLKVSQDRKGAGQGPGDAALSLCALARAPWGSPHLLGSDVPSGRLWPGDLALHSPLTLNGPHPSWRRGIHLCRRPGCGRSGTTRWPVRGRCQARWKGPTAPRITNMRPEPDRLCLPSHEQRTPRARPPRGREAEPTGGREGAGPAENCAETAPTHPPPTPT